MSDDEKKSGVLTGDEIISVASNGGAVDIADDARHVFIDEVSEIAGAVLEKPEEFFSPYAVAAVIANGINNQGGVFACVAESSDRGNEAVHTWAATPDDIANEDVIDYLFKFENGKIVGLNYPEKTKNFSPRFIYSLAKKYDGMPGLNGTSIDMGGKILQKYGAAEESIYPSDHSLFETAFRDASKIPPAAFTNAEQFKIERYAVLDRTIENYKTGIWTGIGNGAIIGYRLGGNMNQPQTPPSPGNEQDGHANLAVGFDKDNVYAIGSWGADYGIRLYLKTIKHYQYGTIFVRGTPQDYVVSFGGVHQIGKAWFTVRTMFRGVTFFDKKFADPALEKRIAMERLVREEKTGRVFWLLNGEKLWVNPFESYESGRGRLWPDIPPDQVAVMPQDQLDLIPDGGVMGKISVTDLIKYRLGL